MRRNKLDSQLSLAVPSALMEEIDCIADAEMCSRAAFVRRALAYTLRRYEVQEDMAEA